MNTEKILSFVKRRFKEDNHWADGNCYWAAFILCAQFPELQMYYIINGGHFVVGNDRGEFFDATGKLEIDPSEAFSMDWIISNDPTLYKRLMRDCRD